MSAIRKWSLTILISLGACLLPFALFFAIDKYLWPWIVHYIYNRHNELLCYVVLTACFCIISGIIVCWKPRFFGFKLGESLKMWKLILFVAIAVCTLTAVSNLAFHSMNPYRKSNWIDITIFVPIREELIYRGVVFTLVYSLLRKLHTENTQIILAVVISSISFGLMHSANALYFSVSIVLLQMLFAAVVGAGLGYLRAETGSIYPGMIIHGVANLIFMLF